MTQASSRKKAAESWDEWWESNHEVQRCKRRRTAWLRDQEVAWWDAKAQQVQDKADQGDVSGVFATFKELRRRGSSLALGDVCPKEVQGERDAWAEHFRLIGEGPDRLKIGSGLTSRVTLPWILFGETPPLPMSCMLL